MIVNDCQRLLCLPVDCQWLPVTIHENHWQSLAIIGNHWQSTGNQSNLRNQKISFSPLGSMSISKSTSPSDYSISCILWFLANTAYLYCLTYLPVSNCKTKYNIELLYATRSKYQSREYSVHLDVYEKRTLSYRGSLFRPLPFLFLPIQCVAAQLNIHHVDVFNILMIQTYDILSMQLGMVWSVL